jgi:protein transport protein SEC31
MIRCVTSLSCFAFVSAHHRPVITTLTRLFKETSEALGGARANPARKREIEDNSRKIGALFAKLNSGDISENASDKLFQLCQALDMNDFSTALQIQASVIQRAIYVFTLKRK